MPIWDLSASYTGCMIGYHAVPVIADAFLKGIKNYDVEKAFEAMKHSATRDKLGLDSYKKYGFIRSSTISDAAFDFTWIKNKYDGVVGVRDCHEFFRRKRCSTRSQLFAKLC